MIAYLSNFKPWVLATAGLVLSVAGVLAVAGLAVLARNVWPEWAVAILTAHLVAGAIVAWVIVGIFFEAILLGKRVLWFEDALERIVDDYLAATEEADDEDETGDEDELAGYDVETEAAAKNG